MKLTWCGTKPKECDVCKTTSLPFFTDGRFADSFMWGIFCDACFEKEGINRYGTGFGQRFDGTTFECIQGGEDYANMEQE